MSNPIPLPPYSLADLFKALARQQRREERRLGQDPTNLSDDYDDHARPWDAVYHIISLYTGIEMDAVRTVAQYVSEDRVSYTRRAESDWVKITAWAARPDGLPWLLHWLCSEYPHESEEMRLPSKVPSEDTPGKGSGESDAGAGGAHPGQDTAPGGGRRGRMPKEESKTKQSLMLATIRRHPSMQDDPAKLAGMVGASESTVRRWLFEEEQKYLNSRAANPDRGED